MLILLCLMEWGILRTPILYVSYFLKKNQWEYYGKLASVRDTGNYEQWVLFFLEAVNAAAVDAIQTSEALKRIQEHNLTRIRLEALRSSSSSSSHPIRLSVQKARRKCWAAAGIRQTSTLCFWKT